MNVRLPSSRIFLPKVANSADYDDDEDDEMTGEEDEGCEFEQTVGGWIEPTLECVSIETVRMFDFTCLGLSPELEMLNQLWKAEELRVSCVKGEFHLRGSIRKLVLVLCELAECDLQGCENLGSVYFMFSHVASLKAHEGTRVEMIGCEVELEPSMKRMRLE